MSPTAIPTYFQLYKHGFILYFDGDIHINNYQYCVTELQKTTHVQFLMSNEVS